MVQKIFYNAFWRMWSPQVKNCRKNQRMNTPASNVSRKPEFHKSSFSSILKNQASKKTPHQQGKDTLHESQAGGRTFREHCAHRPALQLWWEMDCFSTQRDKAGSKATYATWSTETHPILCEGSNIIRKMKSIPQKVIQRRSRGKFQETAWRLRLSTKRWPL